jgi:hypothetical protein
MSDPRTVRLPAASDLYVEPSLGPLLVLEPAAAVAANALRARHVALEADFHAGETDEVTSARVLAHACDQLVQRLNDYRHHVLARLARERSEWSS